ncbi:bifunctional ADP-dependent NAD(P)H-hydrate dehydratase/NAD(P)H-hydrate epimerase [Clostridium formicaceticum]|uniref:Bifunctional NAD(P)H-hydrate repair enzyme n=1 Tax=Clostridium formicaceticum TaxID=1497 RepID=A0AAC9RJ42_9CLOT|nr:bifunctional ADP-dependent NAD(P)H-hydrate dehydratase/NAD(P)H-hydrate epimerase [Clostridium formicaceticum]AOY76319.1 hypothetical protein BJL90_10635 [Clostridium formicaceticum]ARE86707.1 Bifunctional NAD(P)H-hydrate repair enzyme Nnr [Clostridium formicaceticum]
MKVLKNEEMRKLDEIAINTYKIPGIILMENAGISVVEEIEKSLASKENKKIAVISGLGNNGGDGFVITRHLMNKGIQVITYIVGDTSMIKGDAKINFDILEKMKAFIVKLESSEDIIQFQEDLQQYSILVDALLGTGLQRTVEGIMREVILKMNASKKEIIAVDIPSGINGNDGKVQGVAVEAKKTITFQLPKIGNILFPGSYYGGALLVKNIGIPKEAVSLIQSKIHLITEEVAASVLSKRYGDTHKGSYGRAFIIAGSVGMSGAAILASKTALRCGAGLLRTAVPESLIPILENQLIEGITVPVKEMLDKGIINYLKEENVVAIGPGCGRSQEFEEILHTVITSARLPLVIDADGLNLLANNIHLLKDLKAPCIITPHPGEMSRLTGLSIQEVNDHRLEVAKNFSEKWGVITLLKGARTVITDPQGQIFINRTGNPGMATAGSGDVLTGMITGLLSQGVEPLQAAIVSAYLHGKAGDRAAEELGEYSMLAGDIIDQVPFVIQEIIRA